MLFNIHQAATEQIHDGLLSNRGISLHILRLDKIHPVISGNKLFKLHYFIEEAKLFPHKPVVTFGGAYSNHLVATAFACKISGLKSIGIVRGERPEQLSHTLTSCEAYGMQLKFISRNEYKEKENLFFEDKIKNEFDDCIIIPEGGYNNKGAKGAALIMDLVDDSVTHICCAVGTATTIAGLLMSVKKDQQIIGIPVLKGMTDIEQRVSFLTQNKINRQQLHIKKGYHFGGYGKGNAALFSFMNDLYNKYQLATDFVYTGKMMYAVYDLIQKNYFPDGSKIVCLHTGGLQGNLSLPKGLLTF